MAAKRHVRITEEAHKKLVEMAEADGVPLSYLASHSITMYHATYWKERQERLRDIEEGRE